MLRRIFGVIKIRIIWYSIGVLLLLMGLLIGMLVFWMLSDVDCFRDGGRVEIPPSLSDVSGSVRLLALGDVGSGDVHQHRLAQTMGKVCEQRGCDAALLLGDNFYPNGVKDVDDPQWESTFEDVYADLGIPFFAVLGNHDTYQSGTAQIEYTRHSDWWYMPDYHYDFRLGSVQIYARNSNCSIFTWGRTPRVWPPVRSADSPWVIVMGHHSIYSTGSHNDADILSIYWWRQKWDPHTDILLTGHNHVLESLTRPPERTLHLVSGAGGRLGGRPYKVRDAKGRIKPLLSSVADSEFMYRSSTGFIWLEFTSDEARIIFYGKDGQILHQQRLRKPAEAG